MRIRDLADPGPVNLDLIVLKSNSNQFASERKLGVLIFQLH